MSCSTRDKPSKTLLVLSQVYVPDPAAVGQYMADAAGEMVRRGWRVVVLTANRGYDDPSVQYPATEVIDGVEIRRLPLSSFGKRSILLRLLGGVLFLAQAVVRGILLKRLSCLLVSTSPPLCPLAALTITAIRRVPIKYWVMDLNPDQMIALGRMKASSLPVRLFDMMNRLILKRATDVVALDRFMAQRLIDKSPGVERKLTVLPPWPQEEHLRSIDHNDNPFRAQHALEGKFVVMYSGNLSLASPVDTVLEAALRLREESDLVFVFVGGGLGKQRVEQAIQRHRPGNIILLPYQPLSQIKYSLSAADVHLVAMGDVIVGICHPCKVYGVMAVARPVLLLGPDPCHISDMIAEGGFGWQIRHGNVDAAVQILRQILKMDKNDLAAMGQAAKTLMTRHFSRQRLCGAFCDTLERSVVSDR